MSNKNWAWAALPLVLIGAMLLYVPQIWHLGRGYVFVTSAFLLSIELVAIGWLINGRPAGAFIDHRNMLSLSKLQAAAWTVIVLSAFATGAAFNAVIPHINFETVGALKITIPGELLLAMGISATSLVAAPALLSLKANEDPKNEASLMNTAGGKVKGIGDSEGKLLTKVSPKDASWADLFTGDEIGNAGVADLGKIQQALISLVLIGAYAGYVFQFYSTPVETITTLPILDKSFVWLLGISHASYLAYKAAPHTPSAS